MERIELLGVPVDVCKPEEFSNEILRILDKTGPKQIIFLSIWDLIRARRKHSELGQCIKDADLILPVSKSILKGAKFLKKSVPVRYNPFDATIQIMNVLDAHYKTLYLLGGRKKTLQVAERNVRDTFNNLHIVGRYVGYFPKNAEEDVVNAIYKASPSLAIISEGIKDKNLWSYQRREKFSTSIFMFYHDIIGIFSERIKRVDSKTFEKGKEIWGEIIRNPFKLLLIFPFIWYKILLVWSYFFKKETVQTASE